MSCKKVSRQQEIEQECSMKLKAKYIQQNLLQYSQVKIIQIFQEIKYIVTVVIWGKLLEIYTIQTLLLMITSDYLYTAF